MPSAMTQPPQSELVVPGTLGAHAQFAALLQGVGVSPLEHTGWIRVTGEDRVRWLNGMVTNSIQQLKPGEGNYNFFLSAQGRIQGDATIFAEPDSLLIETNSSQIPILTALLDRFIIMDDVELADISGTRSGILVSGPAALSLLRKLDLSIRDIPALTDENVALQTALWHGNEITVVHAYSPVVPAFEIWSTRALTERLSLAMVEAGAALCESQSLEWLRVLAGTPIYGVDIRDRELPQETAQTRALHFAKGCYLGQEIVERIRSRGNVHRVFSGFFLDGALPDSGTKLQAEGKDIGELTSVAAIPLPGRQSNTPVALGYVRREALDRDLPLLYPGGAARPVSLPFSLAETKPMRAASQPLERV